MTPPSRPRSTAWRVRLRRAPGVEPTLGAGPLVEWSEIDAAAMVHMSVHCTGQRGAPAGSRMVTLIGSVCPESRLARSLTYVQPCT